MNSAISNDCLSACMAEENGKKLAAMWERCLEPEEGLPAAGNSLPQSLQDMLAAYLELRDNMDFEVFSLFLLAVESLPPVPCVNKNAVPPKMMGL